MPGLWNTFSLQVLRTALVTLKVRQDLGYSCYNKVIRKIKRYVCSCWLCRFDMVFSIICFLSLTSWFHFLLGKNVFEVEKKYYKVFVKFQETIKNGQGSGSQEDVK